MRANSAAASSLLSGAAPSRWSSVAVLAVIALAILPAAASAAPTITEFASGSGPEAATAGPDGNVWFIETAANKIARVTPGGSVTEFSSGLHSGAGLAGIAAGPDGNLWFTEGNVDRIGRITPAGVITEYNINGGGGPHGIAAGPDGNLWFTEASDDMIGRITTAGAITEFAAGISAGRKPWGIAAGPDGNLWFTEHVASGGVARITTAGVVTELPAPGLPAGIAAGPDGNLWFAGSANPGYIGRITPAGTITQFSAGLTRDSGPENVVTASDGNLYFTESKGAGALGQITPAGVISEFKGGLTAAPFGIAAGADGNVWFTERSGGRVGQLGLAPGAVTNAPSAISATGATLAGSVRSNSQATTYHFEWGLTTAYGSSTAATSAGSGVLALAVTAAITGLAASSTYHYRVVATNASGTSMGQDMFFTAQAVPGAGPGPAGLPSATRPVFGRSAMITAVSGVVLVKLRGAAGFVSLDAASTVPVGTTIDATAGRVRLTNMRDRGGKLQSSTLWGGTFIFAQARTRHAFTVLTLTAPMACPKSARSVASLATHAAPARHLWAKDNHGRFVTRGRSAVATVRGTAWLMQESCAGTLVKVTRGQVSVRDLVRHRTILVSAGRSYLARRR